jgi:hypothetical protein
MPVNASRVQGPELFRHVQGYDRITVGKSPCVKQRGEGQIRRPSPAASLQWDFRARLAAQRGAAVSLPLTLCNVRKHIMR